MRRKLTTEALVLRLIRTGEHDIIAHLLTRDEGPMSAIARGGRRSFRRFGGALEIGTRLNAQLIVRGTRDLQTLESADVAGAVKKVRTDLDRINQLAYVLEIARLTAREGNADPDGYGLVVDFIESLELATATPESMALWELAMLAHLGYALRLGRCVVTGGDPDGVSLESGGAVHIRTSGARDAVSVPRRALETLDRILKGDQTARLLPEDVGAVRKAFERIWRQIVGRFLKTGPFIFTDLR
ncbi:MAG: DNA repair protein RecO [Bradymonadia bacterium]